MKTQKRLLPAVIVSLFAAIAPSAQAQQFSNVYVFGDSLSDAGIYRPNLLALGLPAALVATIGRFTTNPGPVWSEIIAARYGANPAPSNAGGGIYAQGGARVADPSPLNFTGATQRPVSTQITEFLGSAGTADPNALYAIWAGANDIFTQLGAFQAGAITQAQLATNVQAAANAEIAQIARLRAAGARYILVFNLPDIGATPQFAGPLAGSVTALASGYNTALFAGLAGAGISVIPVDTFSLLAEIRANPGAYGFTNITTPACGLFAPTNSSSSLFCNAGTLVAAGAGQTYLFADGVHPTAAAQAIVADFVKNSLEGPAQLSLLPEAALRVRSAHVRSVRDGLTAAGTGQVGKVGFFASVDGNEFTIDNAPGTVGYRGDGRSITIGVTMRASDSVTFGFAAGRNMMDGSFGSEAGGFKIEENAYTIGAALRTGGLYGGVALSVGDTDYNDVRRAVVLGPVTRIAQSRPQGSNSSAFAVAGYDFKLGRFTVGPLVAVASQNVEVQNFEEAGAGTANLKMGKQTRRSEVWQVGARASMDLGGWTPWIRVTADKERKDDTREVSASPATLASGNAYVIPAYRGDTSYVTGQLGVTGRITDWISLSVSYFKVASREGVKEDGITGTVSVRF